MSKENPHLYSDVRNICPHCQKVQSNTEICFFCHREMLPSKDEQIATWKSRAEKLKDEYDIENGIRRAIQSHAEKLEVERDNLKSLCEKANRLHSLTLSELQGLVNVFRSEAYRLLERGEDQKSAGISWCVGFVAKSIEIQAGQLDELLNRGRSEQIREGIK